MGDCCCCLCVKNGVRLPERDCPELILLLTLLLVTCTLPVLKCVLLGNDDDPRWDETDQLFDEPRDVPEDEVGNGFLGDIDVFLLSEVKALCALFPTYNKVNHS